MNLLKRLKFWWFRRNNDVPCHEEIFELRKFTSKSTPRIRKFALMYAVGYTLEEIGEEMGCTRERARQIIWKVYRMQYVDRNV